MSAKKKQKRRPVVDACDDFAALLEETPRCGMTYQPIVGYVFERGPIVRYAPTTWWYDFGRAVSSCWGSPSE